MRSALRPTSLALALSTIAFAQDPTPRAEPTTDAPRGKRLEWTSAQGAPFWYRLPKTISKNSPPNLLLMLHGTGGSQAWSFLNYPIESGRFRPDDIVVSPEGLTPGAGTTFKFLQGKKDGEQLATMIETFRAEFPIGRVYVYGHSQGAFFSYWFAGEYPDLVDGIVAHAGNVLDVKHSKASREGVAIGILHGKADAVVTVECAYRTEKIYKEQGYENVKLYVVEGLTKQSGHWPLPVQVGEMLAWLDEVTEVSPSKAIGRAVSEIRRKVPDLGAIAGAIERARTLAKGKRLDEQESTTLEQQVALAQAFLAAMRDAHVAELAAVPELSARKPEYGAWAARFRAVHPVFEDDAVWKKELRAAVRAAGSHDKKCKRALAKLDGESAGAVHNATKTLAASMLAPSYDALRGALEPFLETAPEGFKPKQRAALEAVVRDRAAADAAGVEAAQECTARAAAEFRKAHPELESPAGG